MTTHEGLEVSIPLTELATDPEDDPLFYRIVSATNGTATLSPDGTAVRFTPNAGHTGPASIGIVADDGFSRSEVATIDVAISDAPLERLDFVVRSPVITAGRTFEIQMIGDFADEVGVLLPASYVTLEILDESLATVSAQGTLSAVGEGNTVLIATRGDLLAATVISVAATDEHYGYYVEQGGIGFYPGAVSLPFDGERQLQITVDGNIDVTETSTGTQYFVGAENLIAVDENGLVTAGADAGVTEVTAIHGAREVRIPVTVAEAQTGPTAVGPDGAVIAAANGAIVQVPPGVLPEGAVVAIEAVAEQDLPPEYELPPELDFVAAVQLDLGDDPLSVPVQLAVPVPLDVLPGTDVFIYKLGTVPDADGVERPILLQVEVGVVGADGMARTTSLPYPGVTGTGLYLLASSLCNMSFSQVTLTAVGGALAASVVATATLGPVGGVLVGAGVLAAGVGTVHLYINLCAGPHIAEAVQIPESGDPIVTEFTFDVQATGVNSHRQEIQGLPTAAPPLVDSVELEFPQPDQPELVIKGTNFGSASELAIEFIVGKKDRVDNAGAIVQATLPRDTRITGTATEIVTVSDTEIRLRVPTSVPLGIASIRVSRTPTATPNTPLFSNSVLFSDDEKIYSLIAENFGRTIAVFDTGESGTDRSAEHVKDIALSGGHAPMYVAATHDGTRAYVTGRQGGVAVIDALALQQIDVNPATTAPGVDWLALPNSGVAYGIAIDPSDQFAYISDERSGIVYVLDISPTSHTFHTVTRTINVAGAPAGLRGIDVSADGTRVYAAAPSSASYFTSTFVGPPAPGNLVVLDVDPASQNRWSVLPPISTEFSHPHGVSAVPALTATSPIGGQVAFTNFATDYKGFSLLEGGAVTKSTGLHLGSALDSFDVDNAREVAVLPAGVLGSNAAYAFVLGFSIPNQNVPSSNHFFRTGSVYSAGSNIGIIADPFGTPSLAAATIPIPVGFPMGIEFTPDYQYLYVTYPSVNVEGGGKGALFVYDVAALINGVENTSENLAKKAIDDVVAAARPDTFGLGGGGRGLAVQGDLAEVVINGQLGDVIRVELAQTFTDVKLDFSSFLNGFVALSNTTVTKQTATMQHVERRNAETSDRIFYFVPEITQEDVDITRRGGIPTPRQARGTFSYTENGVRKRAMIKFEIQPGYSSFDTMINGTAVMDGSVGEVAGAANNRLDVYRVQQRLKYLGFEAHDGDLTTSLASPSRYAPTSSDHTEIVVDGRVDDNDPNTAGNQQYTIEAIKLFQAAVKPQPHSVRPANPFITNAATSGYVPGTIDPNAVYVAANDRGASATNLNGNTDTGRGFHWLNASNAPRWVELLDRDGAGGDFNISRQTAWPIAAGTAQPERFGTDWAINVIRAAGDAIETNHNRTIDITGVSDRYADSTRNGSNYTGSTDGDTSHGSHDSGVDVDVRVNGETTLDNARTSFTQADLTAATSFNVVTQQTVVDLDVLAGMVLPPTNPIPQARALTTEERTVLEHIFAFAAAAGGVSPHAPQFNNTFLGGTGQFQRVFLGYTADTTATANGYGRMLQVLEAAGLPASGSGGGGSGHRNHFHLRLTAPTLQTPLQVQQSESVPSAPGQLLRQDDLPLIATQATAQWQALGLDDDRIARLDEVQFVIADLPEGAVGWATRTGSGEYVVTLDEDAAGYGWFVDATPGDSVEFGIAVAANEAQASEGSEAAGHIDLLTVIGHELGHVLGLTDVSTQEMSIMSSGLAPGVRRAPTAQDLIGFDAQAVASSSDPSVATTFVAPSNWTSLAGAEDAELTPLSAPMMVMPLGVPEAIVNGAFTVEEVGSPEFGWSTNGAAAVVDGQAVIDEDGLRQSGFSQTFVIPVGATALRFTIAQAALEIDPSSPPDAFEVALLDTESGQSLVGVVDGLSATDALLNLQATGALFVGADTHVPGAGASGDLYALTGPTVVLVELAPELAGRMATLYFDLLGFASIRSRVTLDDVTFVGADAPPLAVDLDPARDSHLLGDQITNVSTIDLVGSTDPFQQVLLDVDGDGFDDGVASADANGAFRFENLALTEGVNDLRFEATNATGVNVASLAVVFDVGAPIGGLVTPMAGSTVDVDARYVEVQWSDLGAAGLDSATFDTDDISVTGVSIDRIELQTS